MPEKYQGEIHKVTAVFGGPGPYAVGDTIRLYGGEGDPSPKTLTIDHFNMERYDGDWPPENGAEFIAWFQAKMDAIPEEFRASARVNVDSEDGYEGSHHPSIEITYTRMETAQEVAERLERYAAERDEATARERAQYEKLKAKFEV